MDSILNYFSLLVTVSFFLWLVRNLLFWVGLWQDKEYRLDRLLVHIRETIQGKQILFSYANALKWLLIFLYIPFVLYDRYAEIYEILLGVFFLIQAMIIMKDIVTRRIKRPTFTVKAMAILLMSFGVIALLVYYPLMNSYLWLLIIDRLVPLVVILFVFFFAFPTEIYQDMKIGQATKKMKLLSNILVIAVSGSYGKTSTKEYIAQILSKKFEVVKTPGSNNTPVGITKTILKDIQENTEIFVVEMGAYKRGELAELTRIVQPDITVTTAISDQHFSLYGSLQNVIDSEYELIQALPKNGLALFNGNSDSMEILYERTKTEKIWYQWTQKKPKPLPQISAYNIQPTIEGIVFTVAVKGQEFICKAPLFGTHSVENILPAIFLASHVGFKKNEISKYVSQLTPPPQTMVKRTLPNGSIAMDDTFNASPESVFAAMDFLKLNPRKRIFVLAPLTELGKQAAARHFQIGKKASDICDYLFLLNSNFSTEIFKGVSDGKGDCQVRIARPEVIAKFISHLTRKGDMIIFEGKETKMVLKKLV